MKFSALSATPYINANGSWHEATLTAQLAGGNGDVKDFTGAVATTSIDGFDVGCEMFLWKAYF